MKITIVHGAFLPVPPLLGGAIGKAFCSLGEEFAKQGHSVTQISRRYGDLAPQETTNGCLHIRYSGFSAPKNQIFYKLLDLLYSLQVFHKIKKSDIIITHTFWMPILLQLRNKGAVYVHVGRYPKGQMKFYKNCAKLQAPASPIKEAIIKESSKLSEKTIAIPYPITIPTFDKTIKRKNKLLYCGRIHSEKGLELLIQAYKQLPNEKKNQFPLEIVGSWKIEEGGEGQEYRDHLLSLAKDEPIYFKEPVFNKNELDKIYQTATFFIYPSLAEKGETFGLAPLEAMSNGCIPVVSNLNCFKDFIANGHNGFIFNHREKDPTQTLEHILTQAFALSSRDSLALSTNALSKASSYDCSSVSSIFLKDFKSIIKS